MANHELPCTNCPVPCEQPEGYNPYNPDCDVWAERITPPVRHRNSLPKMDWKAYEKAYYRARNEVPPSERTDDTGTQG